MTSFPNMSLIYDILRSRTLQLDLREHPTFQLNGKRLKEVRNKIGSRTATRQEYKQYTHSQRLIKRRKTGIRQFWIQERKRIMNGKTTTRAWSAEQTRAILEHRLPQYKGHSIAGHHIYSVLKYPHLANRGEVIYPVTFREHFWGWHGGSFKRSLPGIPFHDIKDF